MKILYTRNHYCFMWRNGCEKKAEVQVNTKGLCIATCRDCTKTFRDMDGYFEQDLPPAEAP